MPVPFIKYFYYNLQLTLCGLSRESKVSLSAHIHRDGSVHFAITDKTNGQCDQVSLQAPESA